MAFNRLLSTDRPMRVRLARQLMAAGSYLMFLAPGILAVQWGWTAFGYRGLSVLFVMAVLVNLAFFLAVRLGWTRRFADPSLLVLQLLVALGLAIVTLHYMASEARSVMLMLFVGMFFFGLFGLTTRQFLRLAAIAIAGYVGLMVFEFHGRPLHTDAFRTEVLRLVSLAMITVWMSFIGGYFASLRNKLADRKDALQQALTRLKELSERDELTGARNRRHLLQLLELEKARAERFGAVFCVAIIDLDHFKRFNDSYGHHVGDEILRGFCDVVRQQARDIDHVGRQDVDEAFGRYGGEEFLLVLPHTLLEGAVTCVERIRRVVSTHSFATAAGELRVTFSAGVAEFRLGESVAEVLTRADAALYEAKSGGRDRVLAANDRRAHR